MKKKLIIIDTSAIIHRAYHALPPLTDKQGNNVGAVYGLISMILKIIKEYKPDMLVAALDRPEPSFRKKLDPEYQAGRKKTDNDLINQFQIAEDVLESFNIKKYSKATFEADDVIGTLAKRAEEQNIETIIVTGDLDICQLITKDTKVLMMKRGVSDTVLYDKKKFIEKWSFSPENLTDYKGLRGDSSDNIKGVPRVGEKAAINILSRSKTIKILYEKLKDLYKFYDREEDDLIKSFDLPKQKKEFTTQFEEAFGFRLPAYQIKALLENEDSAFMSKKLATIVKNIDLPVDFNNTILRKRVNQKKITNTLENLGFKSLTDRANKFLENYFVPNIKKISLFEKNDSIDNLHSEKAFKSVLVNKDNFKAFYNDLEKNHYIVLDTEGTELKPFQTKLLGISFCFDDKKAYYLGLEVKTFSKSNMPMYKVEGLVNIKNSKKKWQSVKKILENQEKNFIGHNIKYDLEVLKNHNVDLPEPFFDTMIASFLLNPDAANFKLDDLVLKNFSHKMIPITDLIGQDKKGSLKSVSLERVAEYSAEDAFFTKKLFDLLSQQDGDFIADKATKNIFHKIEMPLIKVLAKMEGNGIYLNASELQKTKKRIEKIVKEETSIIYNLAGEKFNINSTKDLKRILFLKLNIPTEGLKKTGTGSISTSISELDKLRVLGLYPIVDHIVKYREYKKILTTYTDSLIRDVNPITKKIHTSYLQHGAATGRLSSTNPNLQNIPRSESTGEEIRKAFESSKGNLFISADYSQVELRLAAHMSGDYSMIEAFLQGRDFHQETAARIFNIKNDKVTKEQRRTAKTINFGILYGISSFGLSKQLGIRRSEAQVLIDKYFNEYSTLKKYLDKQIEKAASQGFVETLFGRRRYIKGLNTNQYRQKMHSERIAINMPIQGSAADIIKIAMIKINKRIEGEDWQKKNLKMLLQIHDELIFEVSKKYLKETVSLIKKEMENVIKLKIPLEVDVEIGENWLDLKSYFE